ncbi:unnamed protein product [Orchesella dallaii]|uniref:Uncharacterized protein n=1 Tax=Orchesella dallaii TaxID=48710 RepID=A0ABP1S309_9HEXA
MAYTLLVQHLIVIVLINSSNLRFSANIVSASSDYKTAESLIRIEIQKFTDEQLSNDIKLTKVLDRRVGSSSFYPYKNVSDEKPLFSWKSKKTDSEEKVIVIGRKTKNSENGALSEWMSGAFIALRKVKSSTTSPKDTSHYYAQIVYVRKDFDGILVEWDRWSPKIVKNLVRRETEVEAIDGFTVDTFLCAYGTCSCVACKCTNRNQPLIAINKETEDDEAEVERVPLRPKRTRKKYGVATALAYSRKGNALTTSIVKGKGGSRSVAFAETGTAVSESLASDDGDSTAYSRGHDTALSEAISGDGDTKSLAISNTGVAQSSSKSRGGLVEAKAAHTGFHEDWDDRDYDDEEEDDFDAKSLVSDTSKIFSEASERAKQAKITASSAAMVDDECTNEHVNDVVMTLNEWEALMERESFMDENEDEPEPSGGGDMFPYKNPLRYGIDVDLGVNSSVRLARKVRGSYVPRLACCGLNANPSKVLDFLKTFQQHCNPDLEAQVSRLENSLDKSNLTRILKTRKLSLSKLKDLVPMVLLKMYNSESTLNAKSYLEEMTDGKTSDNINLIVAIVVNAARFATNEAHYHKVKILKGLSINVRTVWTGILLEFKKCRKKGKSCNADDVAKLEEEQKLVLGLYLFLRFADARYTTFTKKDAVAVFNDFYKLHSASIMTLSSCKSRSIIFSAAMSRTKRSYITS